MDVFEITKDQSFRAMHEIGHAFILENTKIDWKYVSLVCKEESKGGCVEYTELDCTEENCSTYVLIKMAGEAILRIYYDEISAMLSSKYDRKDVKQFLGKVNAHINDNYCIKRALAANIKFFRRAEIKGKVDVLVNEFVSRKTLTRQEFLQISNSINSTLIRS